MLGDIAMYVSPYCISKVAESCRSRFKSFRTSSVNNCTVTVQVPLASSIGKVIFTESSYLVPNTPSLLHEMRYFSFLSGDDLICPNSSSDIEIVIMFLFRGVRLTDSMRCYCQPTLLPVILTSRWSRFVHRPS